MHGRVIAQIESSKNNFYFSASRYFFLSNCNTFFKEIGKNLATPFLKRPLVGEFPDFYTKKDLSSTYDFLTGLSFV